MFNHTNTPSYFIRRAKQSSSSTNNIHLKKSLEIPKDPDAAECFQESLQPSRSSSCIVATEDKVESINDNIKEASDDKGSNIKIVSDDKSGNTTSISGYRSVSVSTRWAWDDIFHTVNTTNDAGKQRHRETSLKWLTVAMPF